MKWLILCSLCLSTTAFAQSKATQKLFKAIENDDLKLAQRAIKDGADVNSVDYEGAPTTTALLRAAKLNRLNITKLLLANGADVNQRRPIDQYTGLMVAAKYNYAGLAKVLLSYNASVNEYTIAFRTALHVAALHGSTEVAEAILQETDVDVNFRNLGGLCALAVAARQDQRGVVSAIMNAEGGSAVSVDCVEKAAHVAGLNDHNEVLKLLQK